MAGSRDIYEQAMRTAFDHSWSQNWKAAIEAYKRALMEFPQDLAATFASDLRSAQEHLLRRLAGKGEQEDGARVHAPRQEVRHPVHQGPGLAGTGAGDDEQRSAGMSGGLVLWRVEVGAQQLAIGHGWILYCRWRGKGRLRLLRGGAGP